MLGKNLQKHVSVFGYAGKAIVYTFWSNDDQINTVLFLGAGQVGRTIKEVAHDAPPGVAVVGGAPHWEAGPKDVNIEDFMLKYMQAALDEVMAKFRLKVINVAAESQAAPAALVITNRAPQKIGNLTLIYPLGFASKAYGHTKAERLVTFKRRLVAHGLAILLHPRNIAVSWMTVRAILQEPSLAILFKKYAAGLSYDSTDDCRQTTADQKRKNARFTIFLAAKDKLFPLNEMMDVFKSANLKGIDVRVVPGAPHSSVGMRVGKGVLKDAVQSLQNWPWLTSWPKNAKLGLIGGSMAKNKQVYNLEISEALEFVGASREGLTTAEVKRRQAKHGPNAIATKKKPFFKRLLEPFASAFVGVLLVAIVLTIIEKEYVDAAILSITVGINAIIYYAQQYSVSRVLKTLQKKDVSYVHVLRDGQTARIQSENITIGDIVYIEEGMKVPADGRLIESNQVQADEALLTGESLPVHKQAAAIAGALKVYDQRNMLFHGTYIKGGSGQIAVTAIGNQTELGGITALAAQADMTRSPIERKIDSLTKKLIIAVAIIGLVALALEIWRGFAIEEAIRFALVIVVSAVPEGLPVALTIVLLLSARRMAKVRALVKKISSIETMGAVTLIASDKTGTITQNRLSVADKHSTHGSRRIFDHAVRASLNMEADHASDPLDKILLDSVKSIDDPKSWRKVKDYPFNQALRISGVAWQHKDGYSIYIKGAPEHVLEYCSTHHRKDQAVMAVLERFTGRGHRTIAFAHKDVKELPDKLTHQSLNGLDFDGFVGMADQLRPKVAEAVREARRAGVEVIMLTGDHIKTAGYIARQVGIVASDNEVSDSRVLEAGDPEAIRNSLNKTRAFGRVLPEHKYALLKATKNHQITAMTGDGVNDIPALVEADAGIAMGSGTDAAKDASDIVLLDNNFHTIVRAIRVGRTALANIRKMLVYLIGTSGGEVLTIISALILGIPLPVAAIQILWINLVTDGISVIPLGLSPSEPRQMNQPPRAPNASLLNARQVSRIILIAVVMSMTVLWIFASNLDKGHVYAQTLAFLGLVVAQWANAFNVNLEYKSWVYNFKHPNWKLVGAIGFSIILMVVMFTTPLGQFLNLVDVAWRDALIAIVTPVVAVLLAVDLHKLIFYLGAKIRKKPLV